MSIKTYVAAVNPNVTPQSEPVLGKGQVKNNAGGYVFKADDFTRLDRFLILGTEKGSYYATERKLTADNADVVLRCIQKDGLRTVDRIAEISDEGRAPKNDPAIFALALCLKYGDAGTKNAAKLAVSKVCRIGTHIFALADAVNTVGGWGRGTKAAFAGWFNNQTPEKLAHNLVKYQSRNGWSNADVLRQAHVKPVNDQYRDLFAYATDKFHATKAAITRSNGEPGERWERDEAAFEAWLKVAPDNHMDIVWAFERAKRAEKASEIVNLINDFHLPRECVPTHFLNDKDVWAALLANGGKGMPVTAMIRNLAKMTAVGLLTPGSSEAKLVKSYLLDIDRLQKGRVHPLQILAALRTYASGHGDKGSLSWNPVKPVVDALDAAFYLSFKAVEPTNKPTLLALDVSGSMGMSRIAGMNLTPREASVAMALVTAATEPDYEIMGFSHRFVKLDITPSMRLDDAIKRVSNLPFENTDCGLPMVWAKKAAPKTEVFAVYTDNETWVGPVHPFQALKQYREVTGLPAKLAVVGMTSTGFTIADPSDAGMLDVVGFDTAAPSVIADFARA